MKDPYDNLHDVTRENPFLLKDTLKHVARRAGSSNTVIDLSRGDPLDPPSIRARGVELFFDTFSLTLQGKAGQIGNNIASPFETSTAAIEDAWDLTKKVIRRHDTNIIKDAEWIRDQLFSTSENSYAPTKDHILAVIARDIQGADYGDPAGDIYVRSMIASQARDEFPSMHGLDAEGVIVTAGASEAISAIFQMFFDIGYLRRGCLVGCMSPVYSPYNDLAAKYGLKVVTLECDPENAYEPTAEQFSEFQAKSKGIKLFSLVNPSNPTGRAFSKQMLQRLATILDDEGSIFIEDTVYRKLVTKSDFNSIHEFARGNTIVVESVSKYCRSTGLRFGYILIDPEAQKTIGERLKHELIDYIGSSEITQNLLTPALVKAKAPAPDGIFQHTQLVSRPTQWKGIFRMLLGENDGKDFIAELQERWDYVFHALGIQNPQSSAQLLSLPSGFVPYYCLIDGNQLFKNHINSSDRFSPWKFFVALAQKQVVILPAAKFFGNPENHAWALRVSVANQTLSMLVPAMDRFQELLMEFA